jgi:hypothetical protein
MSYVILVRNPRPGGGTFGIVDGGPHDVLMEYDSEDAAHEAAKAITVCKAWPYIVVEAP